MVPSKETFDSGSVMVGESLITEGGLKQTVSGPAEKGQGVPFSFDELTFTQAGEYTFDLYEEQGNAGGVTYDTEHRTVKVTVTLNKANNKLVASADYGTIGNGEDARPGNEFVNTYEATGTYQGVNVAVKLVGKPMSTGDFGFTITSDDSDALAKLTESDKSFVNVTNQDSDVFETMAKLPNMTFDQDDAGKTFVYTVDEIMPASDKAMPGVDYDESEYILEITAIDNGDGTMSTSTKITQVKDSEGETVSNVIYETTPDGGVENPTIPFINIYTPKPATATLNVTKAVYGKDAIESFSFDLTLSSGDKSSVKVAQDDGSLADFTGAKLATSAGIKAGTTEELAFETLTFTKVGTYVFNVDETTTTDEHGWHYDEATHTITVEVTDENYDGQLDAAVKDDNPTFTNYYADATIGGNTKQPLPVNKIVKAQNVGSDWSTDNDFNFTLTPVTGEGDNETDWSSTSCGTTALRTGITDPFKSGDKKTAHFDEITFYEVGEYHFVVTEDEAQQQEPAGWTYDKSKKEIIVTVTDKDTTDGKLDVTVEGEATFTNTFDPSAVEFTPLPVTKVVKPNDAGLTPAGYQFELSVSNTLEGHEGEGFKLPGSVTSESDDTGKVTFDNITFTQVGTYEVTVKEVVPEDANQEQPGVQDENHITYDQHVFTYTVDVTVGEGTLVASVVESTVTSGADTFTNVYFDPVKEVSGSADDGTLTDGSVAAVGDVLTYTIHWSNNAVDKDGVPTNATVTVTDKVPEHTTYVADSASEGGVEKDGTITWTFENQEPGASGIVTYEVTVDESAAQVGVVDNTATVQIGENGPDIDTNTVTTVIPSKDVVAPSDPDTSIDGQLVGVGDKLTYVISYTNPYEEPSTVIITDAVPAGTEFVSADNGGTQSDGKVTWTIEEVPAGESGTVSFTVRVTEDAVDNPGNQVTNEATVKIGDHDPVVTNEVDNVVPEKDVFAAGNTDESIDGDTVSVGDELTYAISYANGEDAAADVTITDSVPAGTEFVSAENGGSEQDGTVTWSLSQVPAGESGTVSFTVRVTEEALEKDAVTNTASVKIGENGPEVKTNTTENPVQTGGLTISKTIELTPDQGTVIDKDQEFQFTLKVLDTAGKPIAGTYSGLDFSDEGTASFSLKHGESMTIEGLPAGATYTVTETPVDHYTQTTPADGAPATGTIPADGAAEAAFVNTYKADDSDPTTLELTKVFEGHEWTEGYSFTFVLAGENGAPMPENNTVTVSGPQPTGEAPIAFGPITYKSVGTYTYTVTETAGENPGIGYDTHTAKVTVEVSDVDGKLMPSVTYEKDVFTNTYNTGTVTVDTSVGLQVVKNMTGRGIMDGDFTFTMAGADDASVARLNDGQPLSFSTSGAALDSAGNVASETINVPTGLTFTNEDAGNTYTYTVSENVPEGAVDNELDGVTYDDTVYTVAFAITENGKGTLSVETFVDGESQGVVSAAVVTNALPAQLVFDNSYDAGEASVDVSATKVLKNHELTDGMFTFDVYNDSVAEGGEARHVLTASNAVDGSVSLGTLSYTTAGINADVAAGYATRTAGEGHSATYVYGYTVHEAAVEGVTNNTGDLHFTVTVTDDGAGHLTAEATLPEGDLVFHNTYGTTESASLSISGVKVLRVEGDNLTPPDITGKYTFTITGVDDQGNELPADLLPEQTQVNNQESGTVDFGSVSYTMASVFGDTGAAAEDGTETASLEPRQRTFTYTITESGEVPGVVNDPEPTRTITVTVTDNGDGTISVAKASGETSDQPGTDFVFTNVYRVRPATSTPTGDGGFNFNKSLVSPFDRPLLEGEFTFQMTDGEGNVVSEATNAADGTISMPAIEFGAPGDYAYTLAEVAGDEDGITYDTRTYTVTAHVADKGDGTLGITWSVDGVEPGGTLTFTNEYAPAPTSITLGARKVLEGRELRAGEFTFQILEGNVVVSTGTNAADGSVEFEPIVYDAPGEHDYTIVEVAGSDAGVTYDDTVYTVHVSVTNNVEANRLETSWSYGEAGQPVFHNSFVEPPEDEPDEPSDGPDEPHDEPDRPSDEPSDGPSGEPSGEPPLPAAGDPIRATPVVAVALAGCVAAIFSALRLRRQR